MRRKPKLAARSASKRSIACLALAGSLLLWPRESAEAIDANDLHALQSIDCSYEGAARENYCIAGQLLMAENLADCRALLDRSPAEYEFLWRAARSAVSLAECARILESKDWKKQFQQMGSQALEWSEAAIRGASGRIEGYFWNLQAVGLLFESEGPIPLISKGLLGNIKRDLDFCETIDIGYLDYTVILARAKYLYEIPPLFGQDVSRAIILCIRFIGLTAWTYEPYRQRVEAAEILLGSREPRDTALAKALLQQALADPTPRPCYRELAVRLLNRALEAPAPSASP